MIKVRIARETDFQDIAQVYIETWRDSYAGTLPDRVLIDMKKEKLVFSFSQTLEHHSEVLVVAEDTKEGIVGMGSAGRNRDRRSKYLGEVYPIFRRAGHLLLSPYRFWAHGPLGGLICWPKGHRS